MPQAEIERLLAEKIGLDPESVGRGAIELAVRRRIEALGLDDETQYLGQLRRSDEEVQELVEEVVVRNSWFFRERRAFAFVRHCCAGGVVTLGSGEELRLLSLGCAYGEEPYSIAIELLDLQEIGQQFRIDAVDISRRALEIAARGRYRKNAFWGDDLSFRDRYFERVGEGSRSAPGREDPEFQIKERVAERVSFTHGNVLEPQVYPAVATYHFIFCRNLLIYMDERAREQTLLAIKRVLLPTGYLLVGSAEGGRLPSYHFETVRLEGLLGFRRVDPTGTSTGIAVDKDAEISPAAKVPKERQRPPMKLLLQQEQDRDRAPRTRRPTALPPGGLEVVVESFCWERAGLLSDEACPLRDEYITCTSCPRFKEHGRTLLDRAAPQDYVDLCTEIYRQPKPDEIQAKLSALVFRLADRWFALPTDHVLLVANPEKIRSVPHRSGKVFRGIVNLTGIRLCVSLHALLDLDEERGGSHGGAAKARMIALGTEERSWVFVADEVHGVRQFEDPGLDEETEIYTRELLTWNERTVGLLDTDLLLANLARIVQ
jgi:chemotaxis protein methyltransferase WspC